MGGWVVRPVLLPRLRLVSHIASACICFRSDIFFILHTKLCQRIDGRRVAAASQIGTDRSRWGTTGVPLHVRRRCGLHTG